ncbi:hypothetical protein P9112_000564 [Eukaryota sp. TZLM1-RC]
MPLSKNALIGIIAGGGVAVTATVVVVVLVVFGGYHEQFQVTENYIALGEQGTETYSIDLANHKLYTEGEFEGQKGHLWYSQGSFYFHFDGMEDTCYKFTDKNTKKETEIYFDYFLPTDEAKKQKKDKSGEIECQLYTATHKIEHPDLGENSVELTWCTADKFVQYMSYQFSGTIILATFTDHEALSRNDDRFDHTIVCKKFEDPPDDLRSVNMVGTSKFAKFVRT